MKDLIDRRDAIDAVCKSECESGFCGVPCPEVDALKALTPAQPESAKRTAEAAQNVSDSDLISRKAAIDAFDGVKVDEENCTEYDIGYNDGIDFAVSRLSVLPSAQLERKRGKWIPHEDEDGEHYGDKCSECGEWYVMPYGKTNYCPNCGADMREVDE